MNKNNSYLILDEKINEVLQELQKNETNPAPYKGRENKEIYHICTNHMTRLTNLRPNKPHLKGQSISQAMKNHDLTTSELNKKSTMPLHVDHINPKIHQKFCKYLKKNTGHKTSLNTATMNSTP